MADLTAISVAAFQTALVNVSVAMGSGDYAGAHVELANAEIALAGLPLSNTAEGTSAQMRQSLDGVRKAVVEAQKRSTGSRFEKHSWFIP